MMDLILDGLQWSTCLTIVYIDDVIDVGRTFIEHLHNLQAMFQCLRDAGLKLKPSKCSFLQPEVQYLGHVILREGVVVHPDFDCQFVLDMDASNVWIRAMLSQVNDSGRELRAITIGSRLLNKAKGATVSPDESFLNDLCITTGQNKIAPRTNRDLCTENKNKTEQKDDTTQQQKMSIKVTYREHV